MFLPTIEHWINEQFSIFTAFLPLLPESTRTVGASHECPPVVSSASWRKWNELRPFGMRGFSDWKYYARSRAGFTLSEALFGKNVGALHLEKTGDHFLVITVRVSAVSSPEKLATTFFAHYSRCSLRGAYYFGVSGMQKKSPLFLWAPFLWGPLFGRTCWTCLNPPLARSKKDVRYPSSIWHVYTRCPRTGH